jgi:cyanate permease
MGLAPDGATSAISDGALNPGSRRDSTAPDLDFSLRETLRMHQFWLLTLATTFRIVCSSAVLVHFVPILVWKGFTQQQAAFYLGFLAFFGMPIHLLIGWIGDRVSKPRLMASCMMIKRLSVSAIFGTESGSSGLPSLR